MSGNTALSPLGGKSCPFWSFRQCLKVLLVVTTWVGWTRDTAKHPTMHNTALRIKNDLAQNVNSVEAENSDPEEKRRLGS